MKAHYKISVLLVTVVVFLTLSNQLLLAFPESRPVRGTGSAIFNERNCTACHIDNAVN